MYLGMTVSRLERELGGQTELVKYAAFLSMWPAGEEAMDLRFQALTKALDDVCKTLEYAIYAANGCKPRRPKFKSFDVFRIFDRLGMGARKKNRKKYFDEMTAAEVNKEMRGHTAIMTRKAK